MRRILRFVALIIGMASYTSYGMSGDWYGHGQVFDPLWFWSRTFSPFQRQRLNYDSRGLPILLPRLKTQEEQAGQSFLERLPLELAQIVMEDLSVSDKQNIALASKRCKAIAQFCITHLAISTRDITKEKLEEIKCNFPNVISFHIKKGGPLTLEKVELLAQSFPRIQALKLLNVTTEALARLDIFKELKELELDFNYSTSTFKDKTTAIKDGITTLVHAQYAERLEKLTLRHIRLAQASSMEILAQKRFKALRVLNLGDNLISENIETLAKAPFAGQLESLNLSESLIKPKQLAHLYAFTALKNLDLSNNEIGDEGIEILTNAPFAHQLEYLNLKWTWITAHGVKILSQPDIFVSLKVLNLADNQDIEDEGLEFLVKAPFTDTLESLDISCTKITKVGIRLLSQPGIFTALQKLNLRFNFELRNDGIAALAKAPFAQQLKSLDLRNTWIKLIGVKALCQPGVFLALKELYLSKISSDEIEILINAPFAGKLELFYLDDDLNESSAKRQKLLKSGIAKRYKFRPLIQALL